MSVPSPASAFGPRRGRSRAAACCALLLAACGGAGDGEAARGPASLVPAASSAEALPRAGGDGQRKTVEATRGAPSTASASKAAATPLGEGADAPALRVAYADGRLSLDARAQPLRKVLAAIQASSGVAIAVAGEVGDAMLTMRFDGVPLAVALPSLLREQDLVLSFKGDHGGASRLQAASVHAKGRGPLAPPASAPMRVSVAGDSAACEAQAAVLDAADLVPALASPDGRLRQRALARSVELQRPLPESTLLQLAAADADREVRLLALGLLAQAHDGPAVRAALQAAGADPDPAVRDQAAGLSEQLDRSERPLATPEPPT